MTEAAPRALASEVSRCSPACCWHCLGCREQHVRRAVLASVFQWKCTHAALGPGAREDSFPCFLTPVPPAGLLEGVFLEVLPAGVVVDMPMTPGPHWSQRWPLRGQPLA